MYRSFTSLEDLFAHLKEDKEWTGANAAQHNRYPIRFVLFENFADFNDFILNRPDGIYKYSIDSLIDKDYPDVFLSYTELSNDIRSFTKKIPRNDFVIYPFSEMARFYNNSGPTEFDSLVKTIRGAQAPEDAQESKVRLYIPIVGMQGKMGKFMNDNSTFVWEYKSGTDSDTYTLVLTNGTTYGVSGLEEKFSYVSNLYQWLKLWEKGESVKKTIICSSPNIYSNAHHAQPDNAFSYLVCENAYQFLTQGLNLDFGVIEEPGEDEMQYWEQLASKIDISDFDFDKFVKERLDTFSLENGYDFIKSWFDCETDFDRWLLTIYFRKVSNGEGYINRVVAQCADLSKSELFSNIATLIFEDPNKEESIQERKAVMKLAASKGVVLTDMARKKLKAKLSAMAVSPELGGYYQAVKLLTPLTDEERQLAIDCVAKGKVRPHEIKEVFPGLYYYLEPMSLNSLSSENTWINEYFDAYKQSKIENYPLRRIGEIIASKNANPTAFQTWADNFKTVKTILHNRRDIDIIYWIDGLGVDWIPFIRNIISEFTKEHVFLNEIHVALADMPTTTSVNKSKLQSLLPEGQILPKIGDLDSFAHSHKKYPQYIIEEMRIVEDAIRKILEDYNGKKIAFVSDHGLTYLSQFEEGMKLAGLKSDHEGRKAKVDSGEFTPDNKYIILDDGNVCSLTHQSLIDKVDKGHGAHGGCTPEEILVPIIIVSPQKNANKYSVNLEDDEIDGTKPVVRFVIKGLSSIDVPTIDYNGVSYNLNNIGGDIYESERLNLVDTATKVSIRINGKSYNSYSIKISTGATEDDLFAGF